MSVFILGTPFHYSVNQELVESELINCDVQPIDWEKYPLKENCLILMDFHLTVLTQIQKQQAKNIKNKRILLVHDHRSLASLSHLLIQAKEILSEMDFRFSDVYVITQLEYDIQFVKQVMPEAKVISRDRWLKELFEIQITPRVFLEFHVPKIEKISKIDIPKKRFSFFVRRFNQDRFEFMCSLLSIGLESQLHYTFANTESDITPDELKNRIPERLEYARTFLENWIAGIPYTVEQTVYYHHIHYPLNLKYYFQKSDINIVYETEPYGNHPVLGENGYGSFITEKTYKAILFKKPFVLVSEQHGLKALKAFGFRTFSPWFNESYDDIENYESRLEAILAEIKRISLLTDDELSAILQEMNEVIEHNYEMLFKLAYDRIPEEFKFKSLLTF